MLISLQNNMLSTADTQSQMLVGTLPSTSPYLQLYLVQSRIFLLNRIGLVFNRLFIKRIYRKHMYIYRTVIEQQNQLLQVLYIFGLYSIRRVAFPVYYQSYQLWTNPVNTELYLLCCFNKTGLCSEQSSMGLVLDAYFVLLQCNTLYVSILNACSTLIQFQLYYIPPLALQWLGNLLESTNTCSYSQL